tara:strand:- start:116 stop:244 length:129 start_codon:yes stop_codon:yes gene_type:complete
MSNGTMEIKLNTLIQDFSTKSLGALLFQPLLLLKLLSSPWAK